MPKIPDEFRKFLKGCSPEERNALIKAVDDDDDDDDGEGEGEGEGEEGDDEGMEKSVLVSTLQKSLDTLQRLGFTAPEPTSVSAGLGAAPEIGLAKSMDATGFVKSLVDNTANALDNLGAANAEIAQAQAVSNTVALATGRLVLGLSKSVDALLDRLGALGAPAQPRSTGARPISKSFGAAGGTGEPPRVTRQQVERGLEKAMREAGEAGDHLRAQALAKSLSTYSGSDGRIIDNNAKPIVAALLKSN